MTRASDKDPELERKAPAPEPAPAPTRNPLADGRRGDYVRVRHPDTGNHYTTTRALAIKAGATLLPDHDAVDRYGRPLPTKYNVSRKES